MSWEHPDKDEHKQFSSVYQVWYGSSPHEGWDMRWHHEKTYKSDGPAFSKARHMHKPSRVVAVWWDGESFQTEIIWEKDH